ncbi:hypothetical protein M0802_002361 [Mischocyttarus mexicanus]|nr:hypothetical protein M0802_002361 [Mischocyttarus mexicanus]
MIVKQAEDQKDHDLDDPVEKALKKTGCIELHYQIQECIAETRDWRKCQDHVKKFKVCMEEYNKRKQDSN